MAPEMLTQSGHSFESDYYALGNFLYEMIFGVCPFLSASKDKIQHDILHKKVEFKPEVPISDDLKDLI